MSLMMQLHANASGIVAATVRDIDNLIWLITQPALIPFELIWSFPLKFFGETP